MVFKPVYFTPLEKNFLSTLTLHLQANNWEKVNLKFIEAKFEESRVFIGVFSLWQNHFNIGSIGAVSFGCYGNRWGEISEHDI